MHRKQEPIKATPTKARTIQPPPSPSVPHSLRNKVKRVIIYESVFNHANNAQAGLFVPPSSPTLGKTTLEASVQAFAQRSSYFYPDLLPPCCVRPTQIKPRYFVISSYLFFTSTFRPLHGQLVEDNQQISLFEKKIALSFSLLMFK